MEVIEDLRPDEGDHQRIGEPWPFPPPAWKMPVVENRWLLHRPGPLHTRQRQIQTGSTAGWGNLRFAPELEAQIPQPAAVMVGPIPGPLPQSLLTEHPRCPHRRAESTWIADANEFLDPAKSPP